MRERVSLSLDSFKILPKPTALVDFSATKLRYEEENFVLNPLILGNVGNPSRDLAGAITHLVVDVGIGKAEYPNSAGLDPN